MAKLTYSDVASYIERQGYKLLSDEYVNAKTKLAIECDKGHVYYITFDSFKSKNIRCTHCSKRMKYTYSEVKEYIEGFGYALISDEYVNKSELLEVMCPKGHIYKVTFGNFKNKNNRCKECSKNKKHTYEFVKEFISKEGHILLSSEYINGKEKLKIQCENGHIYEKSFEKFRGRGQRCPICSIMHQYSQDDVINILGDEGYSLISDNYVNHYSKIKIMCDHGHIYTTTFYNFFKYGRRCYRCYTNPEKYSYEDVKSFIEKDGYTLLSKTYKNAKEKITIMCDKGHIYEQCFDVFKNAESRCPQCNSIQKYTYEEVRQYIESFDYILHSKEYVNIKSPIKVECEKGHKYITNFSNFKNGGCRCPRCNNSKGEELVASILDKCSIEYMRQYRFEDCRYKKPLPFDFYIKNLKTLIEYDGEQHFIPFRYYGGKNGLDFRKLKDNIKTKYCKDNGIKLIRIPYWDFDNIEEILTRELKLNK